ncbi:hypothetical protein H2O14_26455 [Rhizobium sp. G21]|nr:hypothetical protein [Rhizobium sp. G21]
MGEEGQGRHWLTGGAAEQLRRENEGSIAEAPISFGIICGNGTRARTEPMISFIDEYHSVLEIEPMCSVLSIGLFPDLTVVVRRSIASPAGYKLSHLSVIIGKNAYLYG